MKRWLWLTALACFVLTGCGYSFRGTVNTLPRDIRRIYIPTVKNSTTQTGLTTTFTDQLVRQFTISKLLKVTDADIADATLDVSVLSVRIEGGAINTTGLKSLSRRVTVLVSANLKRTDNGERLWSASRLVGRRNYSVDSDQTTVETNVNAALRKIAEDLAEKIHNGIFESF